MTGVTLPSAAAAREYLLGFEHVQGFGLQDFLDTSVDRILTSLALLPPLGQDCRILELGAQPYLMTALLLRHWPAQVEVANEDDRGGGMDGRFRLMHRDWKNPVVLEYRRFNIERDEFPYEDGRFDAVFFCEIIEHLTHDPVHALHEINRVLRLGGVLISSTPNALRLENLWKLLQGKNIYPPFSGWGGTSRHNREFTRGEIRQLLGANAFAVDSVTTRADRGYKYAKPIKRGAALLDRLGIGGGTLDNIHARARKTGPPRYSYPPNMFFDAHAYDRVWASELDMADAPESQLGRGIYPIEFWPPPVRWTAPEAMFRLRLRRQHRRASARFFAGPKQLPSPIEGEVCVASRSARFAVEPGTWNTATVEFEDGMQPGVVEFVVRMDRSWTPARVLGGSDTRELGVAVRRVWLE